MNTIDWALAALAFASITLLVSNLVNEIRRRRKFNKYRAKVVAELRRA